MTLPATLDDLAAAINREHAAVEQSIRDIDRILSGEPIEEPA